MAKKKQHKTKHSKPQNQKHRHISQSLASRIRKFSHQLDQGIASTSIEQECARLLETFPHNTDLLLQYGRVLYMQRKYNEAITALNKGIALDSNNSDMKIMLFSSYKDSCQYPQALKIAATFQYSQDINEQYLAFSTYMDVCDWQAASSMQDRIIQAAIKGQVHLQYMPYLLLLCNGINGISSETLYKLHQQWTFHFQPNKKLSSPNKIQERIRIGYVSADFYRHPVGFFLLQIIADHHRDAFEVFCYANRLQTHDDVTELFKLRADHFIDISHLNDADLAATMRNDGIHIAVDLSGHTFDSRTPAFCKRLAPVQISYLGYPNTSGLKAMDFHITDHFAEDLEHGTKYTEKLLFMPKCFLMYGMEWTQEKKDTAPYDQNGYITFGSFNHSRKLTPEVIHTWSKILQQVPKSKLRLKCTFTRSTIVRNNIIKEFEKNNIPADQLIICEPTATIADHILAYHQVDIALDTFPYTGTTTTCEALSQGVPVVTLVGSMHASRVSYSILKNIGYEETISFSKEEYIEKATKLANNPQGLSMLRKCLPTLLQHSPLRQTETFVTDLEDLYKDACRQKGITIQKPIAPAMEMATLSINDIQILLPKDLNQISTYVVTEQGDWYEDELRFLRTIAKPGMRILDCSAEYGCYSLSLAKEVGNEGTVLAIVHDSNKCNAIEESARINHFSWLSTGTDASSFLKTGVDILIHPLESEDATTSYLDINANHSPLIMIHAMQENGINQAIAKRIQEQGYAPYRLIPALNLLIPLQDGFTPTSWHRQVFFCKKDKTEELASNGFLMLHELESIDLPDDLSYWQKAFKGRVFANALLPLWIEQVEKNTTSDEWEHVRNALSAYAMAHNNDSSAQQRYAYLSAALNILLNTEQLQSSVARLCTVARIASELGNYTIAIQAAQMAHEGITTLKGFIPNEPFLPISSTYDQDDYKDKLAEWTLAQALVLIEKLQHPTSFTSDHHNIKQLNDTIFNLGFPNTALKRQERITLKKNQKRFISASELTKDRPMFSIIIPTRERHDTLKSAIKSALNQQDFYDYEIVVMDNFSSKETYNVTMSFADSKIKYFRSSKRLSMSDNWELGLENSQGEYVFILGDDDAVMPDALTIASQLIKKHNVNLIAWKKPTYWWGNCILEYQRNKLYVSTSSTSKQIITSKDALKRLFSFAVSYNELPGIYNTFVHREIISKIKAVYGKYFISDCPDVYSSIVNAYFSDQYLYIDRSLSLSGNSHHSTGCSGLWSNINPHAEETSKSECDISLIMGEKYRPKWMPAYEMCCMPLWLIDALMLSKHHFFREDSAFNIQPINVINAMVASININPYYYDEILRIILEIAENCKITLDESKLPKKIAAFPQPFQGCIGKGENRLFAINCEQAGIQDPADAARLIQSLWPTWHA